ncbi:MAG: type II toxin-antitoxin system HicA family toxin [Halalkalicoccus sp.]
MVSRDFSGTDIIKVLRTFGYRPVGRTGSHVRLRYENPDTNEVRLVTVPMHDRIRTGTLRSIADQCGANDFNEWCWWIDEHR